MSKPLVALAVASVMLAGCQNTPVKNISDISNTAVYPSGYAAPKTSMEYQSSFEARRPRINSAPIPGYTLGATIIADFNNDGQQDLFGAHDPQAYVQYAFGPNRTKLNQSPSTGMKKLREENWSSLFNFYDLSSDEFFAPQLSKTLKISGDTTECLHPSNVAIGDLNADTQPDIVVGCHGFDLNPFPGAHSYVLLSDGNGQYRATKLPGKKAFTHRVALLDINLDGFLDVVAADGKRLAYYLNNGRGIFSNPTTLLSRKGLYTVQAADLNGDGLHDLLYGGHEADPHGSTPTKILWNDGSGSFARKLTTQIPSVRGFGIVLDFQVWDGLLVIARTGDNPPYQNGALQVISIDSLEEVQLLTSKLPHPYVFQRVAGKKPNAFGTMETYRRGHDFFIEDGTVQFLRNAR